MDKHLEERLKAIEEQLQAFQQAMEGMGRDLRRPVSAVRDGYYEAALTNAGAIIEAMLRDVWLREKITGKADAKTIEQLFNVVKEQAQMDRIVVDYVRDIQLVRNRAAHGEQIVVEDCIECLRKLTVVLDWYFKKYVEAAPQSAASGVGALPEADGRAKPPAAPSQKTRKTRFLFAALAFFACAAMAVALWVLHLRPHGASGKTPEAKLQAFDYDEFRTRYWREHLGKPPAAMSLALDNPAAPGHKVVTLREFLKEVADVSGLNLFVSGFFVDLDADLSTKVSGNFSGMPWPSLLDIVLREAGLDYFCHQNVLVVGPPESIREISGLDTLIVPLDSASQTPVSPDSLPSYLSGNGRSRQLRGAVRSVVIAEDTPIRIAFLARCLREQNLLKGIDTVPFNKVACPAPPGPEITGPANAKIIEFRSVGFLKEEPCSMNLSGADLRDVMKVVAGGMGISYALSPKVQGVVALNVDRISPGLFFDIVCIVNGLGYVCRDGTIRVFDKSEARAYDVSKVFVLSSSETDTACRALRPFILEGESLEPEPGGRAVAFKGSPRTAQKIEYILRYLESGS